MDTQEILNEIADIEEQLQQSKSEKDRLLGRRESIAQTLKEKHGISSMPLAKKKLLSLTKESAVLEDNIKNLFSEIKKIQNNDLLH